nr:acyltransferase family protein [Paenibacillus sp. E194]
MTKRERIQELDAYRALAIMAVLAIHATSEALAATIGSRAYPLYLLINTFRNLPYPFYFLSGFVLFYNYADKPLSGGTIRQFYRKRLLYILVPYLVFPPSIIY